MVSGAIERNFSDIVNNIKEDDETFIASVKENDRDKAQGARSKRLITQFQPVLKNICQHC